MALLICNINNIITDYLSFEDNKSFYLLSKKISNICEKNILHNSNIKINYYIDSNNINIIKFIYKKINRLQIECGINYLPSPIVNYPKGNLLINKFRYFINLKYLDLYKCQCISLSDIELAIKSYLPNLQKIDINDSIIESELYSGECYLNSDGNKMSDSELKIFKNNLNTLNQNVRTNNIANTNNNNNIFKRHLINKYISDIEKDSTNLYKSCFIGKYLNIYNIKIPNELYRDDIGNRFINAINNLLVLISFNKFDFDLEIFIYFKYISNMYISNNLIKTLINCKLFCTIKMCIHNGYKFTPDNFDYIFNNSFIMNSYIKEITYNLIYYLFENNIQFCKHTILLTIYKSNYDIDLLKLFHQKGAYLSVRFIEEIILKGDINTYKWCESVGFDIPLYSDIKNNLIYKLCSSQTRNINNDITYIYNSLYHKGINSYDKIICECILQTQIIIDNSIITKLINWYIKNIKKDIIIHEIYLNFMKKDQLEFLLIKNTNIKIIVNSMNNIIQDPIGAIHFNINLNNLKERVIYTLPLLEWFLNKKNFIYVETLYSNFNQKLTTIQYLKFSIDLLSILNYITNNMKYLNIENIQLWYNFIDTIEDNELVENSYDIFKFLIVKFNHIINVKLVNKIIDKLQEKKWKNSFHLIIDHLYPCYKDHIVEYCKTKNYDIINMLNEYSMNKK
jgi:hypothetical protein